MILRTNRGIATDITKDSAMDFTSPSSHTRLKQEHDEKKQTHHQFILLLLSFHGYVQFQKTLLFGLRSFFSTNVRLRLLKEAELKRHMEFYSQNERVPPIQKIMSGMTKICEEDGTNPNLDMRGMRRIKLTCFTVKAEKYYLYSLGQIRMKLTAIVQLQRGINQILRSQAKMMVSFPMLDDLPILEIFKFWNAVAKGTSTSEDYVCNQFKRLSLPLQVLPLDILPMESRVRPVPGNDPLDTAGLSKGIQKQKG
ncbi:hypothetical protein CFP56_020213 [Quercus suber]|uniref:Uncharacterized protein n=1 Tax=Quercus suber TaxID=58331 RepID=A0AAW0KFP4_QUESU